MALSIIGSRDDYWQAPKLHILVIAILFPAVWIDPLSCAESCLLSFCIDTDTLENGPQAYLMTKV